MADLSQPPSVNQTESAIKKPEYVNSINQPGTNPPPAPLQQQQSQNPNPNPQHLIPSFAPPPQPPGGAAAIPPSFRPVLQFSPLPNFQNPSTGVQPPGVPATTPVMASGAPGAAAAPAVGTTGPIQMMPYQVMPPPPPGQVPMRPFAAPLPPNGFVPPGVAGIQRFPSPYPMVRPLFPRPPGAPGILPVASRPLIPGVTGARPIISPIIRPPIPSVTPAEKPQTIVYIGKISPSVDNEFMLSLLRLCGPVKSWKRVQDPSDGTLRRFGFCEFESAEGVLRAFRLLSKFQIDGQELMLNVDQATKEFLQRYVEKKTEIAKNLKENQAVGMDKEDDTALVVENKEPQKSSGEDTKNDGSKGIKEDSDPAKFGIVTELDIEGDKVAMEKLTSMIEERLKTHPLPLPPPPPPTSAHGSNANSESAAKSRDGDSDPDTRRDAAEDKNNEDTISENTPATELDRAETSSPDRSRKHDRRSRERDREREKEREIERYEREAERERIRKEREQRRKIEEAECEYEERLKDWEYREREKEKQRQYEKEKEKEKERKRRREILYEEEGDDNDSRKRWHRSTLDDKRRKRLREKEEDLADRVKEEEEIAEAKKKAEEEKMQQQQRDTLKLPSDEVMNGPETKPLVEEVKVEIKVEQDQEGNSESDGGLQNGNVVDEATMTSTGESDIRQSGNIPAKKLGFGLVGSGKRTAVPSVFHEEDDDDDARKDKKMRPLVPIDYSTEELQAVQPNGSGAQPPNLAAAAEFAKRISNSSVKEEKPDVERERSRRSHDRSGQRDRDRHNEEASRVKDEKDKTLERDKSREHDKVKTPDKQKILDAKQLIDMIPKTKDELFSYEINWAVYDKHGLHERMRPWISKKIVEFLGEEETTLVDYIVSSTQEHVKATQMLEMLQSILDDEAEMFVLKMWRMLIFEIKKVESGLAKSRS